MIDPFNITKFDRTWEELQEFFLFCICVAGKGSVVTADKVNALSVEIKNVNRYGLYSLGYWVDFGSFIRDLRSYKIGQYNRISKALRHFATQWKWDYYLGSCSVSDLLLIPGVGPKTARFFILHSHKDAECLVLDTHILKFIKKRYKINVPKSTPSEKKYVEIEKLVIPKLKKSFPGKTLAEIDLEIWSSYAKKK